MTLGLCGHYIFTPDDADISAVDISGGRHSGVVVSAAASQQKGHGSIPGPVTFLCGVCFSLVDVFI